MNEKALMLTTVRKASVINAQIPSGRIVHAIVGLQNIQIGTVSDIKPVLSACKLYFVRFGEQIPKEGENTPGFACLAFDLQGRVIGAIFSNCIG